MKKGTKFALSIMATALLVFGGVALKNKMQDNNKTTEPTTSWIDDFSNTYQSISPPQNLKFDEKSMMFSWDPVENINTYIITIQQKGKDIGKFTVKNKNSVNLSEYIGDLKIGSEVEFYVQSQMSEKVVSKPAYLKHRFILVEESELEKYFNTTLNTLNEYIGTGSPIEKISLINCPKSKGVLEFYMKDKSNNFIEIVLSAKVQDYLHSDIDSIKDIYSIVSQATDFDTNLVFGKNIYSMGGDYVMKTFFNYVLNIDIEAAEQFEIVFQSLGNIREEDSSKIFDIVGFYKIDGEYFKISIEDINARPNLELEIPNDYFQALDQFKISQYMQPKIRKLQILENAESLAEEFNKDIETFNPYTDRKNAKRTQSRYENTSNLSEGREIE